MENKKDSNGAFYLRFKERLEQQTSWPSEFLFKFVVPSVEESIQSLEEIFYDKETVIKKKTSSKGNYTSVSIFKKLENPDAVIAYYKRVEKIPNVIAL